MNTMRILRRVLLIVSLAGVLALAGCEIFQELGFVEPDTPVGLTVGNPTDVTLDLSWSTVSGATSYQVFRSGSAMGPWVTQVFNSTQSGFTDTGLTPATTYYYAVQATNSAGSSSLSMAASGTTTGATEPQTLIYDDFTGTFPGLWTVGVEPGYVAVTWGDNYDNGAWSAFCADAGSDFSNDYVDGMWTYMQQTISLADYTSATLSLNYWISTEANVDYFYVYVKSLDIGTWDIVWQASGFDDTYWSGGPLVLDLSAYAGLPSGLMISFDFYSNATVASRPFPDAGVWVDNILLTAE